MNRLGDRVNQQQCIQLSESFGNMIRDQTTDLVDMITWVGVSKIEDVIQAQARKLVDDTGISHDRAVALIQDAVYSIGPVIIESLGTVERNNLHPKEARHVVEAIFTHHFDMVNT